MKAAVYDGSDQIKLVERDRPRIEPGDALLKVETCGICGTDLRILQYGHKRIPPGTERVLGHELAGKIEEVGSTVTWPKPGMRVALAPNIGCGHCDLCIRGYTQLCPDYEGVGVVIDGAMAEYMLIPARAIEQGNVFEIPPNVDFDEAALNEPLSCCYHGLKACHPQPVENLLIIGAGPIGLMYLQLARVMGMGKILVSGHRPERRAIALKMGADIVVDPRLEDLSQAVDDMTAGKGVDVAIVAAVSPEAHTQCLELMNIHGRLNLFSSLPKGHEISSINANLVHYRELIITGTTGQTLTDYRTTMSFLGTSRIDLASLITGRFDLKEVIHAIDYTRSKTGLKTMLFT